MSRTMRQAAHAATKSRHVRSLRSSIDRKPISKEDVLKMRRYLEFIRIVLGGPARTGR